jgi:hypothetical protein
MGTLPITHRADEVRAPGRLAKAGEESRVIGYAV